MSTRKKTSRASHAAAEPAAAAPTHCWELKQCGREQGGAKAAQLGVCPAWPDHGRDCWAIAGTLCGGVVQGTFAEKLGNCQTCQFYQGVMSGEL